MDRLLLGSRFAIKMQKCNHCQNLYDEHKLKKITDEGKDLYFCCVGCEGVYFLLKQNNIQNFYSKLLDTKLSAPTQEITNFEEYDQEGFKRAYTKCKGEFCEVNLMLGGIHCSACIWLIESILNKQEHIKEVYINYTNHKLTIVWNEQKIKLSQIIKIIYSLGYTATIYNPKTQQISKQTQSYYLMLIVAIFCTMNIMWIAIAGYLGLFMNIDSNSKALLNIASFALATPVLFYSGSIFFRSAYYGLKNNFVGMDLLVCTGSTITYIYSIYATIINAESYFESVSMIITFVLIGKFLEMGAKKNAGELLDSLEKQIPSYVRVIRNGIATQIAPQEVAVGESIEVLAGEKIAIDGVLLSEFGIFDEVALSGESIPVEKSVGESINSGSINLNKQILYKATKTFEQSTLNSIIELVLDSINKKPNIQNLANSISAHFSKAVLLIAFGTFLFWLGDGIDEAVRIGVSVIIIACPCALALATPISSIMGISKAYQNNILFTQAKFLETLAKVDTIIFDKTGTLTLGAPSVVKEHIYKDYDKGILAQFLKPNTHPIANGILEHLKNTGSGAEIEQFLQIDSMGISAKCGDLELLGGSITFLEKNGVKASEVGENMLFGFSINGELVSIFELEDRLKDGAQELLDSLRDKELIILSGDREEVVCKVAKTLKIQNFKSRQTLKQKGDVIDSLKKEGKIVAMVGDGINDALALSKSDVAISIADKSDIAVNSSDVIIIKDDLLLIKKAFNISNLTFKTIKQNIAFSIAYNALTIPIAMSGAIMPMIAALSMSLSSILVVLNASRINKSKV